MTDSVRNFERFEIPLNSEGTRGKKDILGKTDREKLLKPAINLKLKTEFSSNLVDHKF